MLDQTSASPLTDELAPKGGAQPDLASRSSSDPADLPNTLDAPSGMLADIGSKPLLPALVSRTLTPHRAARVLPVGILLYLFSVGIVAAATVGILFGIGFFLLAQPKEAMNASAGTGEHDSDTKLRLPTLSNASSTYGDIASVPIESPIPRSAATAALPIVPVAPPAARPSPAGDVPAGDAKDQSFGQGAPALEARAASPEISPPAALAPVPVPGSSIATPTTEPAPGPSTETSAAQPAPGSSTATSAAQPAPGSSTATPAAQPTPGSSTATPAAEPAPGSSTATPAAVDVSRLSAGQITELLARGDSFLHSGDVASARLFYERAADAGDWQAAIRMGATFDATFLGRVGVRAVGDPIKAQSWYRHALDLGAPKTDRQVESPKTK
jgi:hypothetical protein